MDVGNVTILRGGRVIGPATGTDALLDVMVRDGVIESLSPPGGMLADIPTIIEPVVLHHGFAANSFLNWVAPGVVDALTSSGRRVVAIDARTDDLDGSGDPHIEFQRIVLAQDLPVVTNQVPRWLPLEPRYTAPSATPSAQISPGRRSQSDRSRKVAIVAWQVSLNAVKLPNPRITGTSMSYLSARSTSVDGRIPSSRWR